MPDKLSGRTGAFARSEPFDPQSRSLRYKSLLPTSKVLGEEVTASLQGLEHLVSSLAGSMSQSGFLGLGAASTDGDGLTFGAYANAFGLDSGVAGAPLPVCAGGRLLSVGGASTDGSDPFSRGSNDDQYSTILLSAAPATGTREDLVFLEYWFEEIEDTDTYHKWGCVHYLGDALTNDLVNTSYNSTLYNKDVEP